MLYRIERQVPQKDGTTRVEVEIKDVPEGLTLIDLGYDEATAASAAPAPEDIGATPYTFADGLFALDAAALDAELHARIDAEAGEWRTRFITDVAGQQLTYQRKEAEAAGWTVAADPTSVPFLAAEAAATGATIAAVAAEVMAAAAAWSTIGAIIEGERIGAKRRVTAAADAEGKRAAAAVDWAGALAAFL